MFPAGIALIIASVVNGAASRIACSQAKRRRELGIPDPPPPSPEEMKKREKEADRGANVIVALVLLEAVFFAVLVVGPFALLAFAILKAHGIK